MISVLKSLPVQADGRDCYVGATRIDPGEKLADSPLLTGAVLSVGGPGPDYHPVRGGAAGTLNVVEGTPQDIGFGVALQSGAHVIGRAAEADVRLADKDVSRRHAIIQVAEHGGAGITDAGSSNGTFVDGARATAQIELTGRSVIRVGDDKLRWSPGASRELHVAQTTEGTLEFDRAFAEPPTIPHEKVTLPESKEPPERNVAMMLMTGFLGLGAGVIMAVMSNQWTFMIFSLSGVLMPLAQYGIEKYQGKQQMLGLVGDRESAQERVARLADDGGQALRRQSPGPAAIAAMATGARRDLWPRNARVSTGLLLRIGAADQRPTFEVRGQQWEGFEEPTLRAAPVTLNLREAGVLGIVGTGEPPRKLLRWLLVQLATLCSPDDLRFVTLTSGQAEEGAWSRWLPHLDPGPTQAMPCWIGNTPATRAARIDELTKLITARGGDSSRSEEWTGSAVVVVLDGALALRNLPGIRDILSSGPGVGIYVICLDRQGMNECRMVCEVDGEAVRITPRPENLLGPVTPDLMDAAAAEEIARALAPMRDRLAVDAQSTIPYPVRLLDTMNIGEPKADDVLSLWNSKKAGPNVRIALGADASGPAHVDLAGQGPHTMLGGATGAGKSILLQTLVTALLLANRPDELNLVLVDFKGGSAFLPFEHCPHVTALIRSTGETAADTFDEADAARVLASVRAEVSRRESILARYGGELDVYWRARASNPQMEPLPRLVMIFDEFARVLDISPDFLKELVNVAGKGRSLGMHLVLSTQSLQGKLNEELKNNISLRISLRQNETADSSEVLGAPDAASIPGALRGRGMFLWTGDPSRTPHPFQSGYLGNPPPVAGQEQAAVRTLSWQDLGEPRPAAGVSGEGATDQELTVIAIEKASKSLGLPGSFRALLPGLPSRLPLEELPEHQTSEPAEGTAPFGLMDEPDLQAQPACGLDLGASDHLMVAGGSQSGRTTFARALITSLATRFRPDEVHLYVVEHQPAGLSEYAGLPHCGGVFSPAEPDRIRRLVGWLDAETQRRLAARFDPGQKDDPQIVVIVDGWEQFERRGDQQLAEVTLGPVLRAVMETGAPVGVHIVPIGGQDILSGKVPGLCNHRLLLPFPNEDIRRQQMRSGMVPPPPMSGRAIDAATGRHVQICQPGENGTELTARIAGMHGEGQADAGPMEFPSLPVRVNVEDLELPEPVPSASWIPLGVGGDELETVGIDMFDIGPHLMFIAGPARSGRTTAVATLAKLLAWNGVSVLAVAPPQSPLPGLVSGEEDIKVLTGLVVEDSALREAVESFGDERYAVLFDDAERITVRASKEGFSEAPTLLSEISEPSAFGRRALILAADPNPILSGQRKSLAKVTSEIMLTGNRLVLTPAKRTAAKQMNVTLEPDQYFTRPAGRGYLASVGAPTLIQLAMSV